MVALWSVRAGVRDVVDSEDEIGYMQALRAAAESELDMVADRMAAAAHDESQFIFMEQRVIVETAEKQRTRSRVRAPAPRPPAPLARVALWARHARLGPRWIVYRRTAWTPSLAPPLSHSLLAHGELTGLAKECKQSVAELDRRIAAEVSRGTVLVNGYRDVVRQHVLLEHHQQKQRDVSMKRA